ncbi:hypothetical protein RHGRI_031383 [Rhododendron griersonianum]|uniref:Transmembrane protein n=1 Tax=Rhododendron griersonianum TaxID=479676 RepID=A0AAV6I829_9ERIC|nr:hypothetical protein RHGRI_031383 [Rhododendron griersonianum]
MKLVVLLRRTSVLMLSLRDDGRDETRRHQLLHPFEVMMMDGERSAWTDDDRRRLGERDEANQRHEVRGLRMMDWQRRTCKDDCTSFYRLRQPSSSATASTIVVVFFSFVVVVFGSRPSISPRK